MKKHKYGRLCSVNMLFGVEKVMPLKWKIVGSEATIQKDWKGYFYNELERKMEQFFGKMKNEMFYGHENEFKSLDELYKSKVTIEELKAKNYLKEKTDKLKDTDEICIENGSITYSGTECS